MAWSSSRPKHVPRKLREACLARDGHRCTAAMRDGSRCAQTTNLEAHHIAGWQPAERLTVDQLVTLCSWHHKKVTAAQSAAARAAAAQSRARPRKKHPALL